MTSTTTFSFEDEIKRIKFLDSQLDEFSAKLPSVGGLLYGQLFAQEEDLVKFINGVKNRDITLTLNNLDANILRVSKLFKSMDEQAESRAAERRERRQKIPKLEILKTLPNSELLKWCNLAQVYPFKKTKQGMIDALLKI